MWFSMVVHHLEHASATAELALAHASHLCAKLTAPKRLTWAKNTVPKWNAPIAPRSSHSRHSVWEEAAEEGRAGEAFHLSASLALQSYNEMMCEILEKLTLISVQALLNKLIPFHRYSVPKNIFVPVVTLSPAFELLWLLSDW